MEYILKPSLQHIAFIKVAVILWSQDDIKNLIADFRYLGSRKWKNIENIVMGKVEKLLQPSIVKDKLMGFIKPIGIQLLRWIEYHCIGYIKIGRITELYWTSYGTVDKKKTAEILVKDNSLDIIVRYKLACIYYLENDILDLREKISDDDRESFSFKGLSNGSDQHDMVVFCTRNVKQVSMSNCTSENVLDNMDFCQFALGYVARCSSKQAIGHFLEKLTAKEKGESLVSVTERMINFHHKLSQLHSYNFVGMPKEYCADIVCFLLSKMSEEQEEKIFSTSCFKTLNCFLEWPLQCLFLKTASRWWHFLSMNDYYLLLESVINKIRNGFRDFDYQNLFGVLLQKPPNDEKKNFLLSCRSVFILSELLEITDKKCIKLFIQELIITGIKESFFIYYGIESCKTFPPSPDMIELLLQEFQPSKDVMTKFKEECKKYTYECKLRKFDVFIRILDDFACKYDEKSAVEK